MIAYFLFSAVFAFSSQADSGSTCGTMKLETRACAEEFQGLQLERCRVCREQQPCTSSLSTPAEVEFCLAYVEGKNCGYFSSEREAGWCAVASGVLSCEKALAEAANLEMCQRGWAPYFHVFWSR